MLSRKQYTLIQVVGASLGLAIVIGAGLIVDRFVTASWLKWLLGIFALACGQTATQLFAGSYSSYRKYVAAQGGPDLPPSRFWATSGQIVVIAGALAFLLALTAAANRAAEGAWLRGAAALAWVAVPGAVLIYLLIARDWRRELTSRSMLSNERRS
jgi:hypothetical protein